MKASDVCPIGSTVIDGFIVGSESACLRGPKIHSRHQRAISQSSRQNVVRRTVRLSAAPAATARAPREASSENRHHSPIARGARRATTTTMTTDRAPDADADADGAAAIVDARELERAVRDMLRALGEDVEREGLRDTPKRVAKALAFATRGYAMSAVDAVGSALFNEPGLREDQEREAAAAGGFERGAEEDGGEEEDDDDDDDDDDARGRSRAGVVVVRDIPFFSTSEDDLMPFYGRCHVGYVPRDGVIVGLSKVARVAEVFARRVQTPSRLARDVAEALDAGASPRGVSVFLEGSQMGPFGPSRRVGTAALGCFVDDGEDGDAEGYREEFEAMLGASVGRGVGPGVGLRGGGGGARIESSLASRRFADRIAATRYYPDESCGCLTPRSHPGGDGDDEAWTSASTATAADVTGEPNENGNENDDDDENENENGEEDLATGAATVDGDASDRGSSPSASNASCEEQDVDGGSGRGRGSDVETPPPIPIAPAAAAHAVERMMRALGLDKRPPGGGSASMSEAKLVATARKYADLMAASRAGHGMPRLGNGGKGEAAKKRKRGVGVGDGDGATKPETSPAAAATTTTTTTTTMTIERDVPLATLCEHHLLPFHGAVHVAIITANSGSGARAPSRDVLESVVARHGRRLQVQERLTRDVAREIRELTNAAGVMVVARASHLCMIARGVEKPGSTTCTSACLGAFARGRGGATRRASFWRALEGGQSSVVVTTTTGVGAGGGDAENAGATRARASD